MIDLVKTMKIIYLKNRFKLGLVLLLFLVAAYSSTRLSIDQTAQMLAQDLVYMEQPQIFENYYQDDASWDLVQERVEQRLERPLTREDFKDYRQRAQAEEARENAYWDQAEEEAKEEIPPYFHSFSGQYSLQWDQQGQLLGINVAHDFALLQVYLVGLTLFLGLILMSFEYLTNYYEFVRALPWRREMTFLGKLVFGLLTLALAFFLGLGVFCLVLQRSPMAPLFYYGGLADLLVKYAVIDWTLLTLLFLAGSLAGNFLGQLGSFLLLGLLYPVTLFNTYAWEGVLNNRWALAQNLEDRLGKLPLLVQHLVSLFFDGMSDYSELMNKENPINLGHLLLFSLVYLVLALVCVRRLDGSRIQQMIQARPVHHLIKGIALVTMASGLFLLLFDFAVLPILLNLLAYGFFLFLGKLVMDRFFEVKIGL